MTVEESQEIQMVLRTILVVVCFQSKTQQVLTDLSYISSNLEEVNNVLEAECETRSQLVDLGTRRLCYRNVKALRLQGLSVLLPVGE